MRLSTPKCLWPACASSLIPLWVHATITSLHASLFGRANPCEKSERYSWKGTKDWSKTGTPIPCTRMLASTSSPPPLPFSLFPKFRSVCVTTVCFADNVDEVEASLTKMLETMRNMKSLYKLYVDSFAVRHHYYHFVLVCLCACVLVCLCACVLVCLCACVLVCLCACVLVCLCACNY